MHRVDSRTYVGQPNETVTLTTQTAGGGQVSVIVDGQDIGAARQFPLPATPGVRVRVQVALLGPLGATCVVTIAVVDGATDGDFLMCQAHNPAPVNFYSCSVVAAAALRDLATARGLPPFAERAAAPRLPSASRATARSPKSRKASKTGKKKSGKRSGGKKGGAK